MKKVLFAVLFLVLAVVFLFAESDSTVYITKTGKKYHTGSCSYLSKSKISTRLSDAIACGYTPCSRCKPPTQVISGEDVAVSKVEDKDGSLYRVNIENLKSYSDVDLSRLVIASFFRHVDGDTVVVRINNPPPGLQEEETIRMLGVDTPETVHPQKPVEVFGKEASEFTKKRLFGNVVFLAFDWDLRDNYDRLLAYIYLEDRSCHNAALVSQGYAHAYVKYPFQFLEEFEILEKNARAQKRGLWGSTE